MFEIKQHPDFSVLEISGELNLKNMRQFDMALNLILNRDVSRIVLDLTHLSHINYKLVPHLVERMIEIECLGGEIRLAGMGPYVSNILKAFGFEEELYPSIEDAVISFSPVTKEEWH